MAVLCTFSSALPCAQSTSVAYSRTDNTATTTTTLCQPSTTTTFAKRGTVTSAGWQVTLCDPIWHVSSRSGVATLRTAIHLLLTYLLTDALHRLSETHFGKLSSVVTRLLLLSLGSRHSSRGFLSFLFSVAHCLAPASLKLRPTLWRYIQIRLLLLLLLLLLF